MNPWMLREIIELQSKKDRMGLARDLSRELDSICKEANRIIGASFMDTPIPPLFSRLDALKEQLNKLGRLIDDRS